MLPSVVLRHPSWQQNLSHSNAGNVVQQERDLQRRKDGRNMILSTRITAPSANIGLELAPKCIATGLCYLTQLTLRDVSESLHKRAELQRIVIVRIKAILVTPSFKRIPRGKQASLVNQYFCGVSLSPSVKILDQNGKQKKSQTTKRQNKNKLYIPIFAGLSRSPFHAKIIISKCFLVDLFIIF